MNNKKIKIAVKAADLVPLSRLKIIQGDLKSLSKDDFNALCSEIIEKDFSFAFHVWNDGTDLCVLDGTQRYRVLSHLLEHGWTDPNGTHWNIEIDAIPVNYVEAIDIKTAVEKLLGAAGAYGKPDQEGLYALMHKFGIEPVKLSNIRLPGIDINRFRESHFDDLKSDNISNVECSDVTQFIVTVHCKTEDDMQNIYNELISRNFECKLIT